MLLLNFTILILFLSNRAIWRNLKHIKPLSRGAQPVLDTREETNLILFFTVLQPICKQGNGPFVFSCCKHIYVLKFVRFGLGRSGSIAEQVLHMEEVVVESCYSGETAWAPYPRGIYCSDVKQPCTFFTLFL